MLLLLGQYDYELARYTRHVNSSADVLLISTHPPTRYMYTGCVLVTDNGYWTSFRFG